MCRASTCVLLSTCLGCLCILSITAAFVRLGGALGLIRSVAQSYRGFMVGVSDSVCALRPTRKNIDVMPAAAAEPACLVIRLVSFELPAFARTLEGTLISIRYPREYIIADTGIRLQRIERTALAFRACNVTRGPKHCGPAADTRPDRQH